MRVAIITETFAPDLNGVAQSVARTAEHLLRRGHVPMVVAPHPRSISPSNASDDRESADHGYRVARVPSIPVPKNPFRVGVPSGRLTEAIAGFVPDVVHVAAPVVLGAAALRAARRLRLPTTAVYQTDIARFAAGYGLGFATEVAWRWLRSVHNLAERTLAPSTAAAADLAEHRVKRVHLWRRGVDAVRFHPGKRDPALHDELSRRGVGEVVIGYVGRLAPEKHLHLLRSVAGLPGVTLVVVGDGSERPALERSMPSAVFLGTLQGETLARVVASLDLFVHTGPFETFCQTIQEALASGVPVVGPDRGGPLDLVEPGVNGHLFRADDAEHLTATVAGVVEHRDHRARLAAAARGTVSERTWDAVGDELVGHFDRILPTRGIPRRIERRTEDHVDRRLARW